MATKGLRELKKAIRKFPDEVETALAGAVVEEARAVWQDERSWVPVLTGELQNQIAWQFDGDLHATVGIFNPQFFWAVWIEWGRKNAAPQPFATPAAESARRRWPNRAEQAVRRVVR